MNPTALPGIRIITVSGRIASGSTTLAKQLAQQLHWRHIEGGEIFWEAIRNKLGLAEKDTNLRPDQEDALFDAQLKKILREDLYIVLETKLAGFNAQEIDGIFKILVLCTDAKGVDQTQIRIDRLVNREHVTMTAAKEEVLVREKNDIEKWRRLYAPDNADWTYWDEKYYDLIINTFSHDQHEALELTLNALPKTG
jgi:cytidylate kinase